ncbi:hypothetical protein LWI29_033225 [Acer saccharum]|uniref:Uncharacterized protein n=1 Tax=Acer saccharum TaxID=4024 RepID=A0AA39RJG0_ACESA|nr:hypothetical protein LWI29_033225 [Acer saccharum]
MTARKNQVLLQAKEEEEEEEEEETEVEAEAEAKVEVMVISLIFNVTIAIALAILKHTADNKDEQAVEPNEAEPSSSSSSSSASDEDSPLPMPRRSTRSHQPSKSAETVLTVLTGKCLIEVIEDNILWMHDQLKDMGRQIVQQGSLGDPGLWSRLRDRDKILNVLKNEKGTRNIQGIALDIEKKEHELSAEKRYWMNFKMKPTFTYAIAYLKEIIYKNFFQHLTDNGTGVMLHTNSFKPLVNLRLLQINHVKLNGSFRVMPAELKEEMLF